MIVATPHLQLFDFLAPEEVDVLNRRVAERADRLRPATVYTPEHGVDGRDDRTRSSLVDLDATELLPLFDARLRALLPHVRRELGLPHFSLGEIEIQLTVHDDGDFFGAHADENQPWTDGARAVTFVYYFNAEPREFAGGTLRLPDEEVVGDSRRPADSYVEIEPVSNSVVFFSADRLHEVVPVRATGSGPGARRCTVNGWFRHGDLGNPPRSDLPRSTIRLLQPRLLPRLTEPGALVRPIPREDHLRLAAHWARHRRGARPEEVDPEVVTGGQPRILPLDEMADELLERFRPLHEEFAGTPLVATGCTGIREYRRGQALALHVDRCDLHVISSVLHLDRQLDRPWPLRIDCGERTHAVDLAPGQMVVYEGASCPHGRPEPLDGDGYASLFLHYRPVDWEHRATNLARLGQEQHLLDEQGRPTDLLTGPPPAGRLRRA